MTEHSELAAQVREALSLYKHHWLDRDPVAALDALVAHITDLEAQVADARHLIDVAWPHQLDAMADRAEAAEAQVAALTQERDDAKYYEARSLARAEAAEAALAEMEQRWLGMRDCYDREVIRGGKAERALATTRQALTEIAALRARWDESTPEEPFDTVESFWDALGIADRALGDVT